MRFKHSLLYQDFDKGKPFWYLRILLLETKRFPHGLALSTKFGDEKEAEEFQKNVDEYIDSWLEIKKG